MLSTGEEIRSPQRSSRSGPILAKMPCTTTGSKKCYLVQLTTNGTWEGRYIHAIWLILDEIWGCK